MLLRLNSVAMSDHCLFCGIVAGTVPSVKVAEDETTYASWTSIRARTVTYWLFPSSTVKICSRSRPRT